MARKEPTSLAEKRLYGLSGNQCANPKCEEKVILEDGTNVGEIAHIHAANKGMRHNSSMNDDKRRDFNNLILLCRKCHKVVDNKENEQIYTAEILTEWKNLHENKRFQALTLDNSPLRIAVNKIAEVGFSNSFEDKNSNSAYNIGQKISYNELKTYRPLIEQYKVFYTQINSLYKELEYQGYFKKEKLLRNIESIYIKTKGKYIKDHENPINCIKANSDKIFEDVENQLLNLVNNNDCNDNIFYALSIIMVDAFIRCKILEEPI